MTPNIPRLREWAIVLRSGKYAQEMGRLRSRDGARFCCLGVACDLVSPHWKTASDKEIVPVEPIEMNDLVPASVAKEFGVDNLSNFRLRSGGTMLWRLNDSGTSFSEIADIIDQYCDQYEAEHPAT